MRKFPLGPILILPKAILTEEKQKQKQNLLFSLFLFLLPATASNRNPCNSFTLRFSSVRFRFSALRRAPPLHSPPLKPAQDPRGASAGFLQGFLIFRFLPSSTTSFFNCANSVQRPRAAMAPGRRRGANKAKANGHLSLGDLVLAKVKGFPAWPAKVSLSSFVTSTSSKIIIIISSVLLCISHIYLFGCLLSVTALLGYFAKVLNVSV